MAYYTWRTVHTARKEYTLPSPTNWVEVQKVFAVMRSELGDDRAQWDDAVHVEARDGEIAFWYETPAKGDPGTVTVSLADLRPVLNASAMSMGSDSAWKRLAAAAEGES